MKGITVYIIKELEPKLVYASKDGRILTVKVFKDGEELLLVNIYAPNEAQEKFYEQLKNQRIQGPEKKMRIMGDINVIIYKQKDTSAIDRKGRKKRRNMMPKIFLEMAEELNLIDVWRTKYPQKRDYTFY